MCVWLSARSRGSSDASQSSLGFGTTSCLLPLTKQPSAGTPDLATAGPLYHFRHKMAAESNKMYTTRKQEGGVPESGGLRTSWSRKQDILGWVSSANTGAEHTLESGGSDLNSL